MTINKRNFMDYSLLFMVIAVSGIPYFTSTVLYIPISIILMMIFLLRRHRFDKEFLYFIGIVTIITILQIYVFSLFPFQTILGVYLRIFIAYLIVKILNKKFTTYYINIIYYLSIFGTVTFVAVLVIPSLASLLKSTLMPVLSVFNFAGTTTETIIFYNFNALTNMRNSGPFWEPGAFGGYLIIAIIFLYFNDTLIKKKKKLIMLIFALLSTLSTTAFLALSVFLYFYYYKSIQNIFTKIIIVSLMIYGGYYAFFNFDFLGKKIEGQFQMAKNADVYGKDTNTQRFFNIIRDMEDFKDHEIVGRGGNPATRYAHKVKEQIRTVGITDIIVKMGLPFFIYMVYLLYKSICSLVNSNNKKELLYCFGSLFTIFIALMSEVYFNFPIYWSLLFLFLIYKPQKKERIDI